LIPISESAGGAPREEPGLQDCVSRARLAVVLEDLEVVDCISNVVVDVVVVGAD
jgi:hypothetical protein